MEKKNITELSRVLKTGDPGFGRAAQPRLHSAGRGGLLWTVESGGETTDTLVRGQLWMRVIPVEEEGVCGCSPRAPAPAVPAGLGRPGELGARGSGRRVPQEQTSAPLPVASPSAWVWGSQVLNLGGCFTWQVNPFFIAFPFGLRDQ